MTVVPMGPCTLERYCTHLMAEIARLQRECAALRDQLAADTRYELTDAGREALERGY